MFKFDDKLLVFFSLLSLSLPSWSQDSTRIKEVLDLYFQGYQQASTELIQKAFHANTRLMSVEDGKLETTEMKDWLKNLEDRRIRGDIRKGRMVIKSIDVKDYAALAKVEMTFEKFIFTDYLSLLLIEGKWMVVGKIYNFQQR